jgi:hypothetical protein
MKRSFVAATAMAAFAIAAVAWSVGTMASASRGEPAHAYRTGVVRTPPPEATSYYICGPVSAEPPHC